MPLIIHIDGGSRGNPGPAGAGVVIENDAGQRLHEAGYYLGRQTNNAAEYHALIIALKRALGLGDRAVTIHSDSELLINQMTGAYRVKSAALARLVGEAQALLLNFDSWTFHHVQREQNRRADRLANLAMDLRRDEIAFDADGRTAGQRSQADARGADARQAADGSAPSAAATVVRRRAGAASTEEALRARDAHERAVRTVVKRAPETNGCPAAVAAGSEFTLQTALPAGLCLHAAHALLPTVLAMLATDAPDFAALPTVTVRCMRPGCGAAFELSPVAPTDGTGRGD